MERIGCHRRPLIQTLIYNLNQVIKVTVMKRIAGRAGFGFAISALLTALAMPCHAGAAQVGQGLYAGTAKADITPPIGQPMAGYFSRLQKDGGACRKIHDRLYARVVVLKSGKTSVAIAAVDLLLFSSQRVVRTAK